MLKNRHLAKHIKDHAWGKLIQFTQSKAAKAGKIVELVDARYTDLNASKNILRLGLQSVAKA
jgi:IS605 OrfB family transposase